MQQPGSHTHTEKKSPAASLSERGRVTSPRGEQKKKTALDFFCNQNAERTEASSRFSELIQTFAAEYEASRLRFTVQRAAKSARQS